MAELLKNEFRCEQITRPWNDYSPISGITGTLTVKNFIKDNAQRAKGENMCDCVEKIEEKLTEKCKEQTFRKSFKSVEIDRAMILVDNGLMLRTYSKAIIELEGQKK